MCKNNPFLGYQSSNLQLKWVVCTHSVLLNCTLVFTAHHFVPNHTLFLFLVCVLGQFSVQYTLSFHCVARDPRKLVHVLVRVHTKFITLVISMY